MRNSWPRCASRSWLTIATIIGSLCVSLVAYQLYFTREVHALSSNVVISQVYGGGGNSGATLKNDFIELFNRGNTPVNLSGWSVQYASAAGTTWAVTNLTAVNLQPGQYYLVQEAQGAGGTLNLPTPDASGTIAMSATTGKVALVNTTAPLTGSGCPFSANVVDFVGFGSGATCSETAVTPTPSNTTAEIRGGGGCTETDNNSTDFASGTPNPRDTASATNPCLGSTNPSGVGAANPNSVVPGGSSLLIVTVTPGTNPTSTAHTVNADLTAIGGNATQQFVDDGTNGDVTSGDNVFSFNATVTNGTSGGTKTLPFTITETAPESRTGSGNISLTVLAPTSPLGTGLANPESVLPGENSVLTVTVTPGTNPTSTELIVMADLSSIGGSANQQLSDDGSSGGDLVAGNNVFTFTAAIDQATAPGSKSLPFSITDAQSRSGNGSINLTVQQPPPPVDHVVISQLYGGGGNSGATFMNDYVELYNPTGATFDLAGWSLQYASAAGTSWTNKQPIGGTIAPGEYFLVQLASGGSNGLPLPVAPNISGDINMSATTGKIALVNNGNSLTGGCPVGIDPDIVDFVGYGSSATCREGAANAPAPSNSTALFRKLNGAQDTNQNGTDFQSTAPNPRRTAPIVELGPWVAATDPINDGNNAPYDSTITIDFSEPVDVGGAWYDITCNNSGQHNSATIASYNGSKGYHITPNASFQFGEQCTVTIVHSNVHDQDLDDSNPNTDTLFADFSWTFSVVAAGAPAPYPPSVHLTMGNPSGAIADISQPNNYLMEKPTYSLSYNRDKGTPNWVSWHLDTSWFGSLARIDTFRADPSVPSDWYRVQSTDYFASGFDRGHMTPNADRDNETRIPINQETYLMSNMVPQAPDNNQGPWSDLENDLRTLLNGSQNELYIVSGPLGTGGTGSNGGVTSSIADGHVTVPAFTWKVVLMLPKGDDDLSRVTAATMTLAVMMPNIQGIRNDDWHKYLTTVDAVEQATGYDFFANVPDAIENAIEAGTNGNNPPGTENQTSTTQEDVPDSITLNAVSPLPNPTFTTTIVGQPAHGSISGSGLNLTYTPAPNFYGSDSFTYSVNDGSHDSNMSTVNITVTSVNDAPVGNTDTYVIDSNTTLNVSSPGVLSNDTDIDSPSLSVALVSGTSHGTLTLNSDGSLVYSPDQDFSGTDSFTYQAFDGTDSSNIVTVTITVNDKVAPVLTSSVATSLLTMTNSNLINVGLGASASDNSGGSVTIQVAVFGDEDDQTPTFNNIVHSPDAKDIDLGTLQLRGERIEDNDGRVYLIVVTATDPAGNITRSYHSVVVPKSNKQANIDSVIAQGAAAVQYAQSNGSAPPTFFVIGDGPIIGPKQ